MASRAQSGRNHRSAGAPDTPVQARHRTNSCGRDRNSARSMSRTPAAETRRRRACHGVRPCVRHAQAARCPAHTGLNTTDTPTRADCYSAPTRCVPAQTDRCRSTGWGPNTIQCSRRVATRHRTRKTMRGAPSDPPPGHHPLSPQHPATRTSHRPHPECSPVRSLALHLPCRVWLPLDPDIADIATTFRGHLGHLPGHLGQSHGTFGTSHRHFPGHHPSGAIGGPLSPSSRAPYGHPVRCGEWPWNQCSATTPPCLDDTG
jgi:hypothetical protein